MIDGTSGDDTLDGTSGADTINGLAGNDTLNGLAGNDSLNGGDDDDLLLGGAGNDTHTGGAGCDDFQFFPIAGTGEVDVITDFALGDSIIIGDTFFSEKDPASDLITFIGTAAFSSTAGEVRYSTGGGATLIEIDIDGDGTADQSVNLTNGEFTLRTTTDNGPILEIDGAFGAATTGNDKIFGTSGFDSLDGDAGNDVIRGMGGTDFINGGDGDDTLDGGLGNDIIDGDVGIDQVVRYFASQINVAISDLSIIESVSNEGDTLLNIERILVSNRLAPASDDTLDGSGATIELDLQAGAGDDIIIGGSGIDNIEGDSGDDTLTGGEGADRFDFDYIGEVGTTGDVITDLELSDTIDFALINSLGEALDPDGLDLIFIGEAAFSSVAGQFRFTRSGGQTQIQIDVDGDGSADRFVTITAGEFILAETAADSAILQISAAASATSGADSLVGSNGSDTIDGLAGNDTIQGLLGDDSLIGGSDDDLIEAGGGNDTLVGGTGADTLDGGDGDDIADYSTSASGVQIDLNTSTVSMGDAQGDVLNSIEGIAGSAFDDTLIGSADSDTLIGGDGADEISGLGGNDSIDGGDGADLIEGGAGADILIGGIGDDTLSYVNSAAVTVNLDTGTASGADAQGDTISGFDNVIGGVGNDSITGNTSANRITGSDGNDTLLGLGGNDTLDGGDGADLLIGGEDIDSLIGGEGNDTLAVNQLDDDSGQANGMAGGGVLDGGAGIDWALINDANPANPVFDVDDPAAMFVYRTFVGGVANDHELRNIEIVQLRKNIFESTTFELLLGDSGNNTLTASMAMGSRTFAGAGADTVTGGADSDSIEGGAGIDVISGAGGEDSLVGGTGADVMSGGAGGDQFYFDEYAEIDGDTISDLDGDDFINLNRFALNNEDLLFIGDNAFSGLAGEYRFSTGGGQTVLEFDEDGDGFLDRTITITNGEFSLVSTFDSVFVSISNSIRIVNINPSTEGADFIRGTVGLDTLSGLGGNDTLSGSYGDDRLDGGADDDRLLGEVGNDTLTGGAGADRFDFDRLDHLGTFGDIITDLETQDTIDFSTFSNVPPGTPGSIALTFIGLNPFSGTLGEFRYQFNAGTTEIEFDTDGDGVGDRFVIVTNGEFTLVETSANSKVLRIGAETPTSGNDFLFGTANADNINALGGDDTVQGLGGNDTLIGGSGNDELDGGSGADSLNGGSGFDTANYSFATGGVTVRLSNGTGNNFEAEGDTLSSIEGLIGSDFADLFVGSSSANIFTTGLGDDTISTGNGDNFVTGGDDNDRVIGGTGRDTIFGDDGDDRLFGRDGNDRIFGGAGNDALFGNANADILNGDSGNDAFRGLGGNDRINGGTGDDSLLGHTGRDILHGNEDNDILDAGEADDQLFGDDGNDTLFGRDGDDLLEGGAGNDLLTGNLGADTLNGGLGDDTMVGNGGNDVFIFALGDGNDTINAFTQGPGVRDVIQLSGFGAAFDTFAEIFAAATDDGFGNTVIDFGGGDSITLIGDEKADLDADDFVFV